LFHYKSGCGEILNSACFYIERLNYMIALIVTSRVKQSTVGLEGICSQGKCNCCTCDMFQARKHLLHFISCHSFVVKE